MCPSTQENRRKAQFQGFVDNYQKHAIKFATGQNDFYYSYIGHQQLNVFEFMPIQE